MGLVVLDVMKPGSDTFFSNIQSVAQLISQIPHFGGIGQPVANQADDPAVRAVVGVTRPAA